MADGHRHRRSHRHRARPEAAPWRSGSLMMPPPPFPPWEKAGIEGRSNATLLPEPFEGGVFDDGFVEGHWLISGLRCGKRRPIPQFSGIKSLDHLFCLLK